MRGPRRGSQVSAGVVLSGYGSWGGGGAVGVSSKGLEGSLHGRRRLHSPCTSPLSLVGRLETFSIISDDLNGDDLPGSDVMVAHQ